MTAAVGLASDQETLTMKRWYRGGSLLGLTVCILTLAGVALAQPIDGYAPRTSQPLSNSSPNPWQGYSYSAVDAPAVAAEESVLSPVTPIDELSAVEMAGSSWSPSAWVVCPMAPYGPRWFGGLYGLGMTRKADDSVWLSYHTSDPARHLLVSRDADDRWQAGNEFRFGRTLGDGRYALEVDLWGIYVKRSEVNVIGGAAGALNSALDFGALTADGEPAGLGAAAAVNSFFNGAALHRLRRSYEFQNIELNLLRLPLCGEILHGGGPKGLRCHGLLGIRFFRGDDHIEYASDLADAVIGSSNDEVFYNIGVKNYLTGVQLGGRADYLLWRRFSVYTDVKFGLYGNHISHRSSIVTGNGSAVVGPAALANVGRPFDVRSTKNDVAFLGELRLGLDYQFTSTWRLTGGYRAVALSGVALPTDQMPSNFSDIEGVAQIDSSGSMIVHGFLAGIECNF
jgi:hypothetical protein